MIAKSLYLDSSAFLKLVRPEPETGALRSYLRQRQAPLVSSGLLRIEVLRATVRLAPGRLAVAQNLLAEVTTLSVDSLSTQAGLVLPVDLRTLDGIHLAAALSLGSELEEVVTYDKRLADAARYHGLMAISPS